MRKTLCLSALFAMFAVLAIAEDFKGRLVDASCYDQQKSAVACDPSGTTSTFALIVQGKAMKLDAGGNAKAVEALKNRSDRAADPNKPASLEVMAKISGTQDGDTLQVDSIEVQ